MDLNNSKDWRLDKSGRSIAYFSTKNPTIINSEIIESLKRESKKRGNINARLCLHMSPLEELHSMIILEYKNKKCLRPHKHLECDEVLSVIEGKLLFLMFNENGDILNRTILEPGFNTIYKNRRGTYHLYAPISDYAIYNETKNGPFKHEDCLFPRWNHKKILEEQVKFMNLSCKNSTCKHQCSLYRN